MKPIHLTRILALGLALSFAAVGCKKHPTELTNLPNGARMGEPIGPDQSGIIGPGQPVSENTPLPGSQGIPLNPPGDRTGWHEHPEILQPDTIYFDFDSSSIKSSEQPKLAAVADYLKSNPQAAVRVEGNCDERGTEEYNRALGERRALAAREQLIGLGVDASRVDTISYGEDRPADTGHDASAWAKNRRDDFVVLTPP